MLIPGQSGYANDGFNDTELPLEYFKWLPEKATINVSDLPNPIAFDTDFPN